MVEKSPIPVLIDFWAPWCAPCRIVAPAVERLSEELAGQMKVARLNTDLAPALQERFGIRGIPTLVMMEGVKERDRVTGAMNLNPCASGSSTAFRRARKLSRTLSNEVRLWMSERPWSSTGRFKKSGLT